MIDYHDIGKRIRAIRTERGLTQEQLAEVVGTGTTHISHIETGNTIPSLKTFIAIVNALDCSADRLLCISLAKAKVVFSEDLSKVVEDCSEQEIRIISDTMKALKTSLRKQKNLFLE